MKAGKKRYRTNAKKAWLDFEKAVSTMQARMGPKTKITHNEKLIDRSGQARQFDVVIRGKIAGHIILGVIECKNTKRRVTLPMIDAFATKAQEVNANIKLIASKHGFSKTALKKAKDLGIGTISLIPEDPYSTGFSVGFCWYAHVYTWKKLKLTLHFKAHKSPVRKIAVNDVKRGNSKVIDWFINELATTYRKEEKEGWIHQRVMFKHPRKFRVGLKNCFLKGITFHALRTCEKKKKWISVIGNGFLDWQQSLLTVPPKGHVVTNGIKTDLSDWEDHDGDIPPSQGILDCRLTLHQFPQVSDSAHIIDLMAL